MKKFFKILRKVIKILLKSILWLILGIIVIGGFILVIINNKTLKFYENDDGNTRFTMSEDFKVENGKEYHLELKKGIFTYKNIYEGEIGIEENYKISRNSTKGIYYYSFHQDNRNEWNWSTEAYIKLKNGILYVTAYDDGNFIDKTLKINLPSISMIKQLYKNGDIENFLEILPYCFDGNEKEYYENGQIKEEGQFIHGFENYSYTSYYENGQIEEEGQLNKDLTMDLHTGYYINGNIRYFENKDTGITVGYYENGNIKWIQNKSGYDTYYENGNLFENFKFFSGIYNGNGTGYYIDGNIFKIANFESGNEYSTFYNQDGTIFGTGRRSIIDGKLNGSHILMHGNGQILSIENYDGIGTGYYENGNIAFIGNYSTGNLIINGTEYSNEGYILATYDYDGNGNGYKIYYNKNGDILGTGEDIDGETVNGLYINYSNKNGQILKKGNYKNGKPDGYRIEYFENGQIYSEGNYDNGKRVGTRNWYLGDGSIGVSKNYDKYFIF